MNSHHLKGSRAVRSHPTSPHTGKRVYGPLEALTYLNTAIYTRESQTKVLAVRLDPKGWVPSLLWDLDTGEVHAE